MFFILFVYLEYSCFTKRLVAAGVIIELREFLVLVLITAGSRMNLFSFISRCHIMYIMVIVMLILKRLRG